ncbi:hypothetical protein F5Y03DRAFT_403450 [Xylaria venustula]|nr:hypothetical protein F5Y03DRAFT_403450 [Xylaria venustula]
MLDSFSVATIMSWAADLGLFDLNMPLLYGEKNKAIIRLQEEIIRRSNDKSILAWASPILGETKTAWYMYMGRNLASSLDSFRYANIKKNWSLENPVYDDASRRHMHITKDGLEVDLLLIPSKNDAIIGGEKESYVAILDCTIGDNPLARPAIILEKPPLSTNVCNRSLFNFIVNIAPDPSLWVDGAVSEDGSVSKGIGEMAVNTWKDPEFNFQWSEEFDLSKAEVRRITLARTLLRRGTHARNRFESPPLRIGKIVNCDAGEYDVDYALPDFDKVGKVASPSNEREGLVLLSKQGTPRFFRRLGYLGP